MRKKKINKEKKNGGKITEKEAIKKKGRQL